MENDGSLNQDINDQIDEDALVVIDSGTRHQSHEDEDEFTEIYVWGNDYFGQLGVGSEKCIHRLPKVCSFNIVISQVSCGDEHTAFVSQIGGHVYSMGSNSDGKLGIGEISLSYSNVPCLVEELEDIVKVSCGVAHTLAIDKSGKVFTWGQGHYGALGLPNTNGEGKELANSYSPECVLKLNGQVIVDVSAGSRHSLFLNKEGAVFSCGEGKSGQLGIPAPSKPSELVMQPIQIDGLSQIKIKQVHCGKFHSLFLSEDLEIWATGGNSFGQLGTGNKTNQLKPVKISGIPQSVKQISTQHFTAAVTFDGKLYVWGSGIFGESLVPKLIDLDEDCQEVAVGGAFTVILTSNQKTLVWGANTNGEMGLGDTNPRTAPISLDSIEDKNVISIAVGGSFAFALGQKMKSNEGYQTYCTEENIGVSNCLLKEVELNHSHLNMMYENKLNQSKIETTQDKQKDQTIDNLRSDIAKLLQENHKLSNQVKDSKDVSKLSEQQQLSSSKLEKLDKCMKQIAKLEQEVCNLQFSLREKDKLVQQSKLQVLRHEEERDRIEKEVESLFGVKDKLDEKIKVEGVLRKQIYELEHIIQQHSDYEIMKEENSKIRAQNEGLLREKEDFMYKIARLQKNETLKYITGNQSHKLLKQEGEGERGIEYKSYKHEIQESTDRKESVYTESDQESIQEIDKTILVKDLVSPQSKDILSSPQYSKSYFTSIDRSIDRTNNNNRDSQSRVHFSKTIEYNDERKNYNQINESVISHLKSPSAQQNANYNRVIDDRKGENGYRSGYNMHYEPLNYNKDYSYKYHSNISYVGSPQNRHDRQFGGEIKPSQNISYHNEEYEPVVRYQNIGREDGRSKQIVNNRVSTIEHDNGWKLQSNSKIESKYVNKESYYPRESNMSLNKVGQIFTPISSKIDEIRYKMENQDQNRRFSSQFEQSQRINSQYQYQPIKTPNPEPITHFRRELEAMDFHKIRY